MAPETHIESDEELARRARAGSLDDFEELVHRYEARIFHFLCRCSGNPSDARDLTQEAFVAAYQNLERFDPARPFATWLFTIARRKLIDRRRSERTPTEPRLPEPIDTDDPAEQLARREQREDLWTVARECLPEPHFQALWLKYAEDLSVRDIARVLRRTQTHVKVMLFRARAALAEALKAGPLRESDAKSAPVISQPSGLRKTSNAAERSAGTADETNRSRPDGGSTLNNRAFAGAIQPAG